MGGAWQRFDVLGEFEPQESLKKNLVAESSGRSLLTMDWVKGPRWLTREVTEAMWTLSQFLWQLWSVNITLFFWVFFSTPPCCFFPSVMRFSPRGVAFALALLNDRFLMNFQAKIQCNYHSSHKHSWSKFWSWIQERFLVELQNVKIRNGRNYYWMIIIEVNNWTEIDCSSANQTTGTIGQNTIK